LIVSDKILSSCVDDSGDNNSEGDEAGTLKSEPARTCHVRHSRAQTSVCRSTWRWSKALPRHNRST